MKIVQLDGRMSKANVKATLDLNPPDRYEYSMDMGKSWLKYRQPATEPMPLTVDRIHTMNSAGYLVRLIYMENEVTSVMPSNSMFSAVNQQISESKNQKPRTRTDVVYVNYDMANGYMFGPHAAGNTTVCRIERTIVFDMNTPNSNVVTPLKIAGAATDAANYGFVFIVREMTKDEALDWKPILQAKNMPVPVDEWVVIESARVADDEIYNTYIHGLTTCAVLANKYVVGKYYKYGSTFLLYRGHLTNFQERIHREAAWVQYFLDEKNNTDIKTMVDNGPPPLIPNTPPTVGSTANIIDILNQITERGDMGELTEAIISALEYRNKAIDELKKLNVAIEAAKEKAFRDASNT
jgi:hypothetical protein